MKISELIIELQSYLEQFGDLPVVRNNCEGERSGHVEIDDVYVEDVNNAKEILIG